MFYNTALTNEVLHAVAPSIFGGAHKGSDIYRQVPTSAVVERMRIGGWEPVRAQENRTLTEERVGFQKHMVRFARRDDLALATHQIGEVRPEIVLINSHDCSCSYQISLALYRLVCGNGLMVSEGSMFDRRIRHTGFNPDDVVEESASLINMAPTLIDKVQEWQAIPISDPQRMAYGRAAVKLLTEHPQGDFAPQNLTRPVRNADAKPTLWTVFNTVQERSMKGQVRLNNKHGDFTKRKAVKSIGTETSLNRALWTLTEEMAKLVKTGGDVSLIGASAN